MFCNAAPADKSIDPKGELFDFTVPGGMGGQETAARILKINPAAQLIVSSGYVEDPVLARHKKYGFTDVLSKPYTKFAFLDAVGRIIAQHSHPPTMTKEP